MTKCVKRMKVVDKGEKMMIIAIEKCRMVWTEACFDILQYENMYDNFVKMKIDDNHDHSDGKT